MGEKRSVCESKDKKPRLKWHNKSQNKNVRFGEEGKKPQSLKEIGRRVVDIVEVLKYYS